MASALDPNRLAVLAWRTDRALASRKATRLSRYSPAGKKGAETIRAGRRVDPVVAEAQAG